MEDAVVQSSVKDGYGGFLLPLLTELSSVASLDSFAPNLD